MTVKFVNAPVFQEFYIEPILSAGGVDDIPTINNQLMSRVHTTEVYNVVEENNEDDQSGVIINWLKSLPQESTVYIYDIRTHAVEVRDPYTMSPTTRLYHNIRAYVDNNANVGRVEGVAERQPNGWYDTPMPSIANSEPNVSSLSVRGLKNLRKNR
jgi:hypothetical protein